MEKHLTRRAFVATAGSAAVAAAGLAAWNAAHRGPAVRSVASFGPGASAPVRAALVDVEGWLLTPADVDSLPEDRAWIVETQ